MQSMSYSRVGDYLLPDINLSDPPDAPPLGRYGMMHKAFLKEHRPIQYSRFLLSERLYPLFRAVFHGFTRQSCHSPRSKGGLRLT